MQSDVTAAHAPRAAHAAPRCQAAGEVKALDDFYKMLDKEPDKAFYGYNHVNKVRCGAGAVRVRAVRCGLCG